MAGHKSRPPHGGRGLKWCAGADYVKALNVALRMEGVD